LKLKSFCVAISVRIFSLTQILLERGSKFTAKENLAFVSDLLKGPPEKDSRKKLLTILPFMMYIYIEKTRFDETNALVDRLKACTNATPYSASIRTQQCIYIK